MGQGKYIGCLVGGVLERKGGVNLCTERGGSLSPSHVVTLDQLEN